MTLVQTNCPKCWNRMRFKRPVQDVAAIRCPSCRQIFEVESALLLEEPIIAEVVEQEPLAVVVIDEPRTNPQSPRNNATSPLPSSSSLPHSGSVESTAVPLRPVLPHKQASKKVSKSSSPLRTNQAGKRNVWIVSIATGVVLCILAVFVLPKLFTGNSQLTKLDELGSRYELTLESLRRSMAAHFSVPNQPEVNDQVSKLRSLLLDCVDTAVQPDTQSSELRERLNRLGDMQVEVRRLSSQISSSFDRKSLVDQVPSMIELITKQLNYGLRQPRSSREAIDKFCLAAFASFRRLDQSLGKALLADQLDIEQIGQQIDELDSMIVDYSQTAESRTELGYENKQILECGAAWRSWCLRQLQVSGNPETSQAVSKELDALRSRFDLAIKAVAVDRQSLAAIDRINKRINDPMAAAKSDLVLGSQPRDSTTKSQAASNPSPAVTSAIVTSPGAGNHAGSSGNSPSANGSLANNSVDPFQAQPSTKGSTSTSANDSVLGSTGGQLEASSSTSANNGKATDVSSSVGSVSNMGAQNSGGIVYFPPARYQGPNTLTIKVTTTRSSDELRQLGASIAAKIGSVLDFQAQGSQATMSFNNFAGQVHDAIKHVSFGKVEIADSQSRTLFVQDSQ